MHARDRVCPEQTSRLAVGRNRSIIHAPEPAVLPVYKCTEFVGGGQCRVLAISHGSLIQVLR